MAEDKQVQKLRRKLEKALAKGRAELAIDLLEDLVDLDPNTPRWQHKRGDLLRKQGQIPEAIACYAKAVDLYADQGFIARAVAMAKTILDQDPTRIDILERVDPQAAQAILRVGQPAKSPAQPSHPMVIPDESDSRPAIRPPSPAQPSHPMVIPDESDSPPAIRPPSPAQPSHPMAIPDGADSHPMVIPAAPPAPRAVRPAAPQRVPAAPREHQLPVRPVTLDQISLPPPRPAHGPSGAQAVPAAARAPDVADIYSEALLGAPELTVDPAAAPNETRFSMAPDRPRDSFSLELDQLEFESRLLPPPRDSLAPEPTAGALAKLPLFPLFADVGRDALATLMRDSQLVEGDDGDMVVGTGEPAEALFGILEGGVRIVVPGQTIQLALAEGDVFGESCLLDEQPRVADAVVLGHFVGLRIPRSVLHGLIQQYPPVAEILLALLTRRLLGNLLQTSPLFVQFEAAERAGLARMFEVRRAAAGTQLARCGMRMDGLYISLTGKLAVLVPGAPTRVKGPGHMFGQAALLSREPSRADITAVVNMIVLRLPADTFARVAMQHPMVLAQLAELADQDVVRITT